MSIISYNSYQKTIEKGESIFMKIAVASDKKMVSKHFGKCENFNFFEIIDGEIVSEEQIYNNLDCLSRALFLKDNNIEVVISGGMGKGASNELLSYGLKVIIGACGPARDVALEFYNGNLESTLIECNQGHHNKHGHSHKYCKCYNNHFNNK